jgi:dipeptidyl aminopeptidase/acylaminoacyl peptidase
MTIDRADLRAAAAELSFDRRAQALHHGPVRACWTADGRAFWYRTRTSAGIEYVRIDVATRRRSPLFDAARVALELAGVTGTHIAADALPLARIRIEPDDAVCFDAMGSRWCWRAADAKPLVRTGQAWSAHEAPSPDDGAAVSLAGANLCLRERADEMSHALTHDGEPGHGWGDFTDFIMQLASRRDPARRPSVLWSPDSQRLAVMRIDVRQVRQQHLLQSAPPGGGPPVLHAYPFPTPRDAERGRATLWFIGRDGSHVRAQIDGLECHAFTHLAMGWCRWSADGSRFYLVDGSRDARRLVLWSIDPATGAAQQLLEETGPAVVLPSPSIAEPAIFHVLRDGRVIWWSQRSGWGHLYRVDPAAALSGAAHAITAGEWQVRALLHVNEASQRIVFLAGGQDDGGAQFDPYLNAVYAVNFDGSGLTCLSPEPGQHEMFAGPDGESSIAPLGGVFVDNVSSVERLPRARLRDVHGAVLMELEAAAADASWPADLPLPEPFCVTALDGTAALWGVLYKPRGFDAGKRYPVVEVIYGAPQTAVAPKTWLPNRFATVAEQLAAIGFVVLVLDGPGTPYRSHAFQLESHGHIERCGGLPDHVHTIRTLAGHRPWMDLDCVGIVGASGGGYAVVRAMAEFPAFYKAGVSMCGNHDQADYIAMWGERYQGLYDPRRYATQANATVADRLAGELLLIHGDMDENVHPAMTLRLADALIQADRHFEMLIVPNAGHMVILLPWVQRRVHDFFIAHLMRGT